MSVSLGALGDTGMARSSIQDAELQTRQREADAARRTLNGGQSVDNKDKKLRESCEGFEAMFIQKMWESMRATLPKDGLTSGGRDEKTWQGMYDQELGKSMAKAGGIGLADMMVTQLSRNLQDASEVAAQRRSPMSIAPVPLMPDAATQNSGLSQAPPKLNPLGPPKVTDLYSGEAMQPQAPGDDAPAGGSENGASGATGTTVSAEPVPPAVQSVLKEFAAQTGTVPASSPGVVSNPVNPTTAGLVPGAPGNPVPGAGMTTATATVPAADPAMAPAAAAGVAAQTSVPAEAAPQVTRITHTTNRTQRVPRPPKGMPRMTPRNPNLRTEAPAQPPATPPAQGAVTAQQANMTVGSHFASTSSGTTITRTAGGMTSGEAQAQPGTATSLMKEQMS